VALVGSTPPVTFAAAPPRPVATTQRAVVAPQAFKPDDPVMKAPQAAKALSATMVSATFENLPAMKAFAEMAKQSGYIIEPYAGGGNNPTKYANVTAKIVDQPFWAAMREICTRGNVALYYYGDDEPGKIQLMPSNYGQQNMMKAAASIQGPYLSVVTNIDRVNTVNLATPDKTDRKVNLQIHTFAEPKARPMQYSYQPTIDDAVDDNGNKMVPDPNERQGPGMQSNRGISWYCYVQLPYPKSNPGKRIARVRGHIDAKVQLQSEPWEIADPLKAAETSKTVAGKKYTFKSLTKSGDNSGYKLEIVVNRGADEDQNTFQQNAFNTEPVLKLTDASDGRYQPYSSGGTGGTDSVTRQFQFSRRGGGRAASEKDPPAPTKLVIELPTATQDVPIPFELVDLPMP
jgi:hypothetical protein